MSSNHDQVATDQLIRIMESLMPEPHLTAALEASQAELDMSGATPFYLKIIVTLHAQKPLLCYVADTFLWPQNALRKGGINFAKLGSDSQQVQRSTVSINTGNFTERPWDVDHCLLLHPGKPVSIRIPFGSQAGTRAHPTDFDVRLWVTTSGFETGSSYEATLPATGTISWWRWASLDEVVEYGKKKSEKLFRTSLSLSGSSSTGKDGITASGVPVLPKEQQLTICGSGDKVVFTCLGRPVGP